MPLKFHLDEHVPHAIAAGLRRRGFDVTTTADAGLISAEDIRHVEFARRERRILYTQDADYLVLDAAGVEHCGIVYNQVDARSVGAVIDFLTLLSECMSDPFMRNHVEFA